VGDENPYENATRFNTSTEWLSDQKPVDLDLDGMADYAQSMKRIQENLRNELGYVDDLHSVPVQAWEGAVLGEADYVRTRMGDNATELNEYIRRLSDALLNIGMAAQTVADTYASTDGWSAASLNTVLFAFADPGATRPAGLHPMVGNKTYDEWMAEAEANAGAPGAESPDWGNPSSWESRENPDGSTTQTATTADGHRMEITTLPSGATTTTIFGPNGNRISTTGTQVSTSSGSYYHSTTTTQTRDGQVVSSTTRTSVAGSGSTETVVTHDAQGNETGRRTVTTETNDDGSQTVTTRDASGNVTDEVRTAPQTTGGPDADESPRQRAYETIPDMY
jgi:hypothetical protein